MCLLLELLNPLKRHLKNLLKTHSSILKSKYTNSKKQNEIMKKLNKNQERNKKVDLDNLPLYDCIQEQEDDWVSSILGSETDALNDLF